MRTFSRANGASSRLSAPAERARKPSIVGPRRRCVAAESVAHMPVASPAFAARINLAKVTCGRTAAVADLATVRVGGAAVLAPPQPATRSASPRRGADLRSMHTETKEKIEA